MGSLEIVSMDFKNDALNRISQQESYLNYPVIYHFFAFIHSLKERSE